ncbi:hypothetical protein [Treponema sp.]|uniref:hypothetical protein n=1 Tax=Treponema sp. TaxID=166 RepID=UPI00298DDB62|nr:hypothetical protein [Treponema sp.]MCQ2240517.1 hypothetical protein [Treponema sp.]
MKITKYTAIAALSALTCLGAFAQDFDDFGDFGDIGGGTSSGVSIPVSISGEAGIEARGYLDTDSTKEGINRENGIKDINTTNKPNAKLNFKYSGATVEAEVNLKFDRNTLNNNREDILDEALVRGIFMDSALTVEAGKMRTIWGKGDRLHVIDNFNADDYSDFIVPLYKDRRIAVPMLKTSYALPRNNMVLEAIWTPGMEADRFATDGRWTPAKVKNLKNTAEGIVAFQYAAASNPATQMKILSEANRLSSNPSALYPDTNSLKYNQAGLRLTGTVGNFDLGASYYYGHYKQVSVNSEKAIRAKLGGNAVLPEFDFDRKQTFGLEAATIFWKLNLRGELCYNLTADTDGTNPWVHNNSIQWLGGFDIDLPISNINVNIQETGTYILNKDKVKNGDGIKEVFGAPYASVLSMYDVDYDAKDRYTTNHLVINITDSWKNGKIEPEVTALWSIERGDLAVMPKVNFKPNQDITFTVSGLLMYAKDENSEFAEWSGKGDGNFNNSYIGVGVKCKF